MSRRIFWASYPFALLMALGGNLLTTTFSSGADKVPNPQQSSFTPVGGFQWQRTISRRPVFTVDYWPGVPAVDKEGRADISADLKHMTSYTDPVTVRTLRGSYIPDRASGADPEHRGSFVLPNLLEIDDQQLRQWQQTTKTRLQPLLDQYRAAGVYSLDLQSFFERYITKNTPEWYRQGVPDWAECDLSGNPLPCSCLSHPKMHDVLDKTFEALSFLKDEPVFLGFHLGNEPHLGLVENVSDYGGNPHTKTAFRRYLHTRFSSVADLNQVAGTAYPNFEAIDIADPNWLIRTMAARFRSSLVLGVMQKRLAALSKKHFPNAVTMTRLETGYWLREQAGTREINAVEFAGLKDSDLDIISWSHTWDAREPDGMGQLHVTGGLLHGLGKPIGFTEPHLIRYGESQYCILRPEEVQHFVYRGLFYNFRMFNLHSWDRTGGWSVVNEPFGLVFSKQPGLLRMVAQLRTELDRSAPYETFGQRVMPDLRLLVTSNARHFPGMAGWCYGNWLSRLCPLLERPQLTCYEVLEEQTSNLQEALRQCRGVVVVDACLSPATRQALSEFVDRGGRLLVFGAPATVGPNYEQADLSNAYPVTAQRENLGQIIEEGVPAGVDCQVTMTHPVLDGMSSLEMLRPANLQLRPSAKAVLVSPQGEPVGAASDQVVYLAGFPTETDQQELLLKNFARWAGTELPEILVSRFENAIVVQNWDTDNHRLDGTVIDPEPFIGQIPMSGTHDGAIREYRQDHPWMAYHRDDDGRIVLEGVRLDVKDVKVFYKDQARELPHFEGIDDTVGFSYFWAGESHPIIARFTVSHETDVDATIVGGPWSEEEIGWFVAEIGEHRVAEGSGRQVHFHVEPGKRYYLTAVLARHPDREREKICPLCEYYAFE